ncbi:hypothetical protein [Virgibacillus sp. Bac330]|uniref:hypothetical protein n=1 Tax=Virgibacillus sp. Bac330 TaxID=2419841 RepID=UPI000EF5427E|nr:hypothetical protein [Virgibacillus sp. Bac330]
MKIKFEEWLHNQNIDNESNDLFNESVICYKAGAYRAALLFSFIGFQTILKQRIIYSKPAKNYVEKEWGQLKKELIDDDKWDKVMITKVEQKKKPIFNITEDLREQYMFWKNRRNDCAHGKGNIISYPHVEGFWLFIQSNLGKFVVNGGMESLLNEIKNYFNPSVTPPDALISTIIERIPLTLEQNEYHDFFLELKSFSTQTFSSSPLLTEDEKIGLLWHKLLLSSESIQDKLIDFLLEEQTFTLEIIKRNNKIVKFLSQDSTFIRKLWKEHLTESNDYLTFMELIRNDLIPKNQLNESYQEILNKLNTAFFDPNNIFEIRNNIEEVDKHILKYKGFFKLVYNLAFEEEYISFDFNWANRNKSLIIYYIEHFGLDKSIVKALNKSLNGTYPPFRLAEEINFYYQNETKKLKEHVEISKQIEMRLPKVIEDLQFSINPFASQP